jgi:hypothetical protein
VIEGRAAATLTHPLCISAVPGFWPENQLDAPWGMSRVPLVVMDENGTQ